MTVEHVEFLVEEASVAEVLQVLLPKLLGRITFSIHAHQSKQDLLARLPGKLSGYSRWIPRDWRIVVLIDRDGDRCDQLKTKLERIASRARLLTRSKAAARDWVVAHRMAIEELEAWYFGDWGAVRAAYPRVPKTVPRQQAYRDPDAIGGGTWEAFERLMQGAGYFAGRLRKLEAARAIAPHMIPDRNTSASFCAFRDVLVEMTQP